MLENYLHQRNYACRIREYIYQGLRVLSMENELIKVSILVDKGTDIYEFIYKPKDIDFMWHSFNGIRNPDKYVATKEHPGGAFLDYYEEDGRTISISGNRVVTWERIRYPW